MDFKYVIVACIVLVCNLHTVFGQSLERGVAFPEDVLIGADKMFSTGVITQGYSVYGDPRNITLIPVQGRIQYSEVGTGYLIGFQFYNLESSYRDYASLNFHVYRKTNPADADTDFAGYYTLIKDLIYSTIPGFNVVYFEKAVHVSEGVNEDIYIGFLPDYSGKIPILYDSNGCDGPEVYLKSKVLSHNHVVVGDTVRFYASDPPNQCRKYSFQAIFAPSSSASVDYGNCSLIVAIDDRARYIEFNEYYVEANIANYSGTACYIIRADRRDRGLILVENSFQIGENNGGCENSASHLQIYEGNRLTADSAGVADGKLWSPDLYCGYDIFNEKYTTFPYLKLNVRVPQEQLTNQRFYFAVYIRIENHAKLKIGLSVAFVILAVIGLILLVLVCTRKGNKTVSGSNTGSQAQPLVHTHVQPAGGAMYIASNPQPSSSMQSQPTTQPVHPANPQPYSTYQGLANQPQASNTGQYSTLQNDGDGMGPNPSAPRNSDLYSEVDPKTML